MELTNKAAVITGGATGIGAASAILYARAGAKVIIGDINVEGGEQTVATIQSEGGAPNLSEPMSMWNPKLLI